MRFLSLYHNNIVKYDFITKFNTKKKKLPKISKFVISINSNKDSLISLMSSSLALEIIAHQKTSFIFKKVNQNPNVKVKLGIPTGCKVTLRKTNMLNLLTILFITINPKHMPRLDTVNLKKVNEGNIHLCISNLSLFEGIERNYYFFRELSNIKVSITTNLIDNNHLLFILSSFKIFKTKS